MFFTTYLENPLDLGNNCEVMYIIKPAWSELRDRNESQFRFGRLWTRQHCKLNRLKGINRVSLCAWFFCLLRSKFRAVCFNNHQGGFALWIRVFGVLFIFQCNMVGRVRIISGRFKRIYLLVKQYVWGTSAFVKLIVC